jgi:hypothetical protein
MEPTRICGSASLRLYDLNNDTKIDFHEFLTGRNLQGPHFEQWYCRIHAFLHLAYVISYCACRFHRTDQDRSGMIDDQELANTLNKHTTEADSYLVDNLVQHSHAAFPYIQKHGEL